MVRAFETHKIRKTRELSGSLWDFQTLPEEGDAVRLKTPVPGCWQSEPETLTYRGKACYERKFSDRFATDASTEAYHCPS